ncbi:hypothetical protein KC332_g8898 [Hortaea werneckii]|uniref:Zn(2)-C6 fungal-type domain-containing protein n=2 Tax=Hortaea werneckii TaxID=91943 RepID=A0A3M7IKR7_HORWE|nr:hypothetical protein KC358_g5065 [Hortaea werneckii]KAI6938458.1 hypothetical protein KC341_g4883 [Hortaea werneckii]KAI6982956.1 hypothetical protein KC329_g8715 [Hortaea werneckii]KAI7045889.1 hypothetical protein KC366_g3282 [Hortaea werneckii]KAI7134985.1 hypothetical protein KC337_g3375 [Hortaea werneckii]
MDHKRPPAHYAAAPPPPHSTIDRPPPPPHYAYPPQQPQPQPQPSFAPQPAPPHPHPHPPTSYAPAPVPPSVPGSAGPSLPPLQQQAYGPPGSAPEQQSLPPIRHPSHPSYDARDSQEHYRYMQDPRSGHATPAPVVNRTYSHDSAPQRTPTTPAQPTPFPPGSSHEGAPPAPHHPMEHQPHHYPPPPPNGMAHGLPPPGPPPSHPEQHQQYGPPVVENHTPYGPPPPQPQQHMYQQPGYQSGPISAGQFQALGQRKKQMRATQACEQCRQRKQKCDEGSPCSFCKENNLSCQYRDTPPAKTDKNMERLLQYMESHGQGLSALTNKIDDMDVRLQRLEGTGSHSISGAADHHTRQSEDVSFEQDQEEPFNQDQEDQEHKKPQLEDHRTAPHKLLLLWPSVKPLLEGADVHLHDSYVMEAEDRGILRLFTRGEGIDEHDGTQPGGPASPARSDDSGGGSESNAPAPAEGLWGTGFPTGPPSDIRRSEPYTWGGLKPDGSLDLDVNTINSLYDSYMEHIQVMHPFLDKPRLRRLFDQFIKNYSSGQDIRRPFAVSHSNSDFERSNKRLRTNDGSAAVPTGNDMGTVRVQLTERSPSSAIVYLVLALGKICQHRDPLPGVVPDNRMNANSMVSHHLSSTATGSSPLGASIKPSPISPKSTPVTQPTPPNDAYHAHHSRSRRASADGIVNAGGRNLDVIPGLAYYAKACEVMGDQADANDLCHVQMFLLAGLYKGQLARVKESMSWFTMAGRASLMLLDRYKLYNKKEWGPGQGSLRRGQEMIKTKRHNLIVLAAWTCLQLESDILAELRLPSSHIQEIENRLAYPKEVPKDENTMEFVGKTPENPVDIYYSFQLWLRLRLNQIHREMYGAACVNQPLEVVRQTIQGHDSILEGWRDIIPAPLQWSDSDPPASDILAARLRAKYWGARYVVNRPYLDYALHIWKHVRNGRTVREAAFDAHRNPRDEAEIHLFEAIQGLGEAKIWGSVKTCIEAAMQSTVALDGVPARQIVTNIHGTAHAQFGNMLVLSAAFQDGVLKQMIDEERFKYLLERTISFLRRLAPISPTCGIDCGILENIQRVLFGTSEEDRHFYKNEGVNEVSAELQSTTRSFQSASS